MTEARRPRKVVSATSRARGWFVNDEPDFRSRALWLTPCLIAMAILIAGRLLDVQLRQGPALALAASRQHQSSVPLLAHRGRIYDRNGLLLVSDIPVYAVYADPGFIAPAQRSDVARQLAPILRMGPGLIEQILATPGHFVYLAHHVSEDVKKQLSNLNVGGIGMLPEEERSYPPSPAAQTSGAANLLGYVNHDGVGQYGVEGYYNSVLQGVNGKESTLQDEAGNSIKLSHEQRVPARDGHDLQLGLDPQLQYRAEDALSQAVAATQSSSGSVMVMDTSTGAIRAWADYPSYDASHYSTSNVGAFLDANIGSTYEPGSVMKVVTFAGALERHAIIPETTINEGPVTVDGFIIGDWDHKAHGVVNMQQVLDQSLNDGAIKIMQMEGSDGFYSNLLAFGMGAPTGIDLSGEANKKLKLQTGWSASDYATASFGQGIQITPVEMLAAVNAVGNSGVWVQPHAVEATIDPTTGVKTPFVPVTRRILTVDTAATLTHMMTGVVENKDGSGFAAKIAAFQNHIAGKTGTASVPVNGQYGNSVIVSFVGTFPIGHPQLTMMVILRSPNRCGNLQCEGAYLAAPVWQQLALWAIDAWKILP